MYRIFLYLNADQRSFRRESVEEVSLINEKIHSGTEKLIEIMTFNPFDFYAILISLIPWKIIYLSRVSL